MKKTIFLAAIAALIAIASCQKEVMTGIDRNGDLVFTATIGQGTKTTVSASTGVVSWVKGDTISITDAAKTSAKYTVSSIDTEGKATFTKVKGESSLGDGPYTAVYGSDPDTVRTYDANVQIPDLPMSAESETTELTFTVSCGLLELSVKAAETESAKNVTRIIVKGKPTDTKKYPGDKKGFSYFILNCSDTLDISSEKKFYIVLPAGNYTAIGITNSNYLGDVKTPENGPFALDSNTIARTELTDLSFENVVDIKCKEYKKVTINNVIWMKENLACDKYDTESEVYKDGADSYFGENNYIIPAAKPSTPTFKDTARTPYYTDATDRTTWSQRSAAKKQQTSLTEAQIAMMGYLYNWAAAVGVATNLLRTTDFTGNRQGICPNGWHVPSKKELDALKSYIEAAKGTGTAGFHLKSTSGWYNADNSTKYPQGVDTYGFDLLPSGFSAGDSISNVGAAGHVLTSSPSTSRDTKFYYAYGSYTNSKLPDSDGAPKCNGRSLRCIKNN